MAVKEKENVEKGVRVLIKKRGFTFHKKDVIKGGKAQQVDPNIIEAGRVEGDDGVPGEHRPPEGRGRLPVAARDRYLRRPDLPG